MAEKNSLNSANPDGEKTSGSKYPFKKKIINILGLLFLGPIGGALWEKGLTPLFLELFEIVSDFFKYFTSTFIDSVYQEVSNGFHESYSLLVYTVVWMLIAFLYFVLLLNEMKRDQITEESFPIIVDAHSSDDDIQQTLLLKLNRKKRLFRRCMIVATIVVTFISIFVISRGTYINSTTTRTLSNIEIVSAVIDDNEYRKLRSDFYSMNSEKDFLKLQSRLQEISEKNNIKLKE